MEMAPFLFVWKKRTKKDAYATDIVMDGIERRFFVVES
jgi:hypothetical protein